MTSHLYPREMKVALALLGDKIQCHSHLETESTEHWRSSRNRTGEVSLGVEPDCLEYEVGREVELFTLRSGACPGGPVF